MDCDFSHIIADRQFSKGSLDKNILIDFFKNIDSYKNRLSYYPDELNIINKDSGKFVYGVDEWFLNNILIQKIVKTKVKNVMQVRNNIYGYVINQFFMDKKSSIVDEKKYKEYMNFFKWIFPDKKFKNPFEGKKELKDKMKVDDMGLILRTYEYFISVIGSPREKFYGKKFLDHVLSEKLIGMYSYGKFEFYNVKLEDLYFEKKYLPLNDINYLRDLMGYDNVNRVF